MKGLTLKEQSRLRRLLREFARAKTNDWEDDIAILQADIDKLMAKLED
jgi:hypothetical protein